MAAQALTVASTQNRTNSSEIFAVVQQVSAQINKNHIQEVVDKAKGLDIEDKQLVVNLLGVVRLIFLPLKYFNERHSVGSREKPSPPEECRSCSDITCQDCVICQHPCPEPHHQFQSYCP
jgi:hypothetical protein